MKKQLAAPAFNVVITEGGRTKSITCGPFSSQHSAEAFATALAHGGGLRWGTKVSIKPRRKRYVKVEVQS